MLKIFVTSMTKIPPGPGPGEIKPVRRQVYQSMEQADIDACLIDLRNDGYSEEAGTLEVVNEP